MIIKKSLFNVITYSLLLGIIYPITITLFAHFFYYEKANGSPLVSNGIIHGSKLIGQNFSNDKYLWPRPSAVNYDPKNSSGTNYALSNPEYLENLKLIISKYKDYSDAMIPNELVTSSASGLDPEISFDAATYQIPRISKVRSISEEKLYTLFEHQAILDQFGEKRINVLTLNFKLDEN